MLVQLSMDSKQLHRYVEERKPALAQLNGGGRDAVKVWIDSKYMKMRKLEEIDPYDFDVVAIPVGSVIVFPESEAAYIKLKNIGTEAEKTLMQRMTDSMELLETRKEYRHVERLEKVERDPNSGVIKDACSTDTTK